MGPCICTWVSSLVHSSVLPFPIYRMPHVAGTALGMWGEGVDKTDKAKSKPSQRHLGNGRTVCVPQALRSGSFPQTYEKLEPACFMSQAFSLMMPKRLLLLSCCRHVGATFLVRRLVVEIFELELSRGTLLHYFKLP